MCKSFLAAVSQIVVGIFSFSVVAEAAFPIQSPLLYIPRARFASCVQKYLCIALCTLAYF